MKKILPSILLSAALALTLAACNFDTTTTPGDNASSDTTTPGGSTDTGGAIDTTISPKNIDENFFIKLKTAVGGAWIHIIAQWEDSAFAVKNSDLIIQDAYKPVINGTISFAELLPGEASSSSSSRTWGVGFENAGFVAETKHSLVLHMNVNGSLYKITIPFIGKNNANDEEFEITEEGISFERVGNKLDVPGDDSENSGNNSGNSGDDGTYENGHGAGAVSEVRPSPSVSGITTSTNDVTLKKNLNSWSSVVFQFTNSTGKVWSDDEIYLYALCQVASATPSAANPDNVAEGGYCYVTPDGKLHAIGTTSSSVWEIKFSEIKDSGIEMPFMQSGRIFYSYGQPLTMKGNGTMQGYASPSLANPSDPNYNKYYDWLEFSVATNGFWVNTTQVDQLGFPVLINVFGKTEGTRQDTVQTTGLSKTRAEIWDSFKNYCPDEFDTLAGTYRIVAPGKKGFDERAGDRYGNYFDDYVNYVWDYYKTNSGSVTHPKGVFTISGDGTNLYFKCIESRDDNQMGKKGETYTVYGKPTTSMVLEGYGVLASGNAMELALEAWICAAFNRGVAHLAPDAYWNNPEYYYRGDLYGSNSWWRCNWYSGAWHKISESGGLAYGFCYDDVNDQSATTYVYTPENVVVKLGF